MIKNRAIRAAFWLCCGGLAFFSRAGAEKAKPYGLETRAARPVRLAHAGARKRGDACAALPDRRFQRYAAAWCQATG